MLKAILFYIVCLDCSWYPMYDGDLQNLELQAQRWNRYFQKKNLKFYSGQFALIQSQDHAANRGKTAGRYQCDTHLTGIRLRIQRRGMV